MDKYLKSAAQDWAKNKEARLKKIEQNGSLSIWDKVTSIPADAWYETKLELEEQPYSAIQTSDPELRRDEAYALAEERARQVYESRQSGSPQPSPTPVGVWERMLKGKGY